MYNSNPFLTKNARLLRRNMTKEERRLWYDFLKSLPVTVNRQKVIGPYIVDFCCYEARLIVELDGSQHFEPAAIAADRDRDVYLRKHGFTVLRYSNAEIRKNFVGVCEDILNHITQEKGNIHLYEKLGYHQTGKTEKINNLMDIVFLEKIHIGIIL